MNTYQMIQILMNDNTQKAKRLSDSLVVQWLNNTLADNTGCSPSFYLADQWDIFTYRTKTLTDFNTALTYIKSGKVVECYINRQLCGSFNTAIGSSYTLATISNNMINNGQWYLITLL